MKVLDLFSGIGGFSLGLERAGMETVAFCEIEEYPRKVLKKHWPDVPIYEDVRTLTKEVLENDGIGTIDVICGGFPCQDLSVAGKKAGFEGVRSSLYREMLRLVSECRPRFAIFENVTGLLSGESGRWFAQFLYDLAAVGYDAEWHCISASAIGAHHHRDRVWIIAYQADAIHANLQRCEKCEPAEKSNQSLKSCGGCDENATNTKGFGSLQSSEQSKAARPPQGAIEGDSILADTHRNRQQEQRKPKQSLFTKAYGEGQAVDTITSGIKPEWSVEPELGRVANGIPNRTHRLKCLGNAVVSQIPEIIGRAIMEIENET